jgi:hypothetical protein
MAKKQAASPSTPDHSPVVPSPRSRREELLDALLAHTANPIHLKVLHAYKVSGTVEGAEQELAKIIQEIVDEA